MLPLCRFNHCSTFVGEYLGGSSERCRNVWRGLMWTGIEEETKGVRHRGSLDELSQEATIILESEELNLR